MPWNWVTEMYVPNRYLMDTLVVYTMTNIGRFNEDFISHDQFIYMCSWCKRMGVGQYLEIKIAKIRRMLGMTFESPLIEQSPCYLMDLEIVR